MNDTATNALRKSILHWRRLARGKPQSDTEGPYSSHCALCNEYLRPPGTCYGCPVFESTNQGQCYGTPYHRAWEEFRVNRFSEAFRAIAYEELEFLKSLLPTFTEKEAWMHIADLFLQGTAQCGICGEIGRSDVFKRISAATLRSMGNKIYTYMHQRHGHLLWTRVPSGSYLCPVNYWMHDANLSPYSNQSRANLCEQFANEL